MKSAKKIKNLFTGKFIIFSTISVAVVIFIIWFFVNLVHIQKQKVKTILEAESTKIEIALMDRIDSTYSIIKSLNSQILIRPSDKNYVNKILQKFRTTPELNENFAWTIFSWSNADHQIIVDAEKGIMSQPFDLSIRDYIPLTKKDPGKLHLGVPVIGSTSKKLMIPGGVGLVDKNKKYLGAVTIGFEIKSLERALHRAINSYDVEFELISQSDLSILNSEHNSPETRAILKNREIKAFLEKSEISPNKTVVSVNMIKDRHGVLVKKLENMPYFVVLNYNKNALYDKLWKDLFSRLVEIIIMFSVLAALLIFIYKREHRQQRKILYLKHLAEKSNEAKDSILASIAHDIKNYVFGIYGLAEIFLGSKKQSKICTDEDIKTVEMILDHSGELMNFVEDLLDTSQVEAGAFSLTKIKECDIKSLIDRTALMNNSLAIRNNILLKTFVEKDLPKLKCDPRRMKQILVNLISNAIKYGKSDTAVKITVKHLQESNQIYIEIVDQGIGMTEAELEKYLAGNGREIDKSSLDKEIDSYGIGVATVLALVVLHDGIIEVESQKNVGTKVKLYFKVSEQIIEEEKLQEVQEEYFESKEKSQNRSILFAEDNPVNAKITCKILRDQGYKVYHAENGKEALRILDQEHIDLILSDGEMPVMNGYEAAAIIRDGKIFKNFKNYENIPIIGFMSSSTEKTISKTLASGMNFHIEKSTSKKNLLEVINQYLENHDDEDDLWDLG